MVAACVNLDTRTIQRFITGVKSSINMNTGQNPVFCFRVFHRHSNYVEQSVICGL